MDAAETQELLVTLKTRFAKNMACHERYRLGSGRGAAD
jgi:hypothetical protein